MFLIQTSIKNLREFRIFKVCILDQVGLPNPFFSHHCPTHIEHLKLVIQLIFLLDFEGSFGGNLH